MSPINRDDLKTILRFALHVARVDDDLAALEKNVLRHYIEVMGLAPEEQQAMSQAGGSLADGLENLSGMEAKALLVKTLCAVANADGVMHEKEVAFIGKVNAQLGEPVPLLPWEAWNSYEQEVLDALKRVP